MFISCKKAGELASESHDRKLSVMEKLSFKIHLSMCKICKVFAKQYELVKEMTKIINKKIEDGEPIGPGLSEEASQKIKIKISSYKEE
ncbi:MAG: hypothetical protein COA79_02875 [Planctomycetota bacterium]|nr:MAG: hypothetical protein COA79_02875 [Planctomycetota bacterium]